MAWRKPTSPKEWLALLLRHKKKALFPALIAATAFLIYSHQLPRLYSTGAEFRRFNDTALQLVNSRLSNMTIAPMRHTLVQDIKGRRAIEQVIEDLQLTNNLPHNADGNLTNDGELEKRRMVKRFSSSISVGFQVRSNVEDRVRVSISHRNRDLAPRFVNRLVENYVRETRKEINDILLTSNLYFENEVDKYRVRVDDLTAKKLMFEMTHPNLVADDPLRIKNRLTELHDRYDAAVEELASTRTRAESLKGIIADQPEDIVQTKEELNPDWIEIRGRLTTAREELDKHLYEYQRKAEHPLVKKAMRRIEVLEGDLAGTEQRIEVGRTTSKNQQLLEQREILSGLIASGTRLEGQQRSLTETIEQFEILDRDYFRFRNQYQEYLRDLEEAEEQLGIWQKHLQDTRIALASEISNVGVRLSLEQLADEPQKPTSPNFNKILMMAAALALAVGGGIIIVAELLDHTLHSVEQTVDDLKLPVFGAVDEIVLPNRLLRKRLLTWCLYPPIAATLIGALLISVGATWISLNDPAKYDLMMNEPGKFVRETLGVG